MTRNDFKKLIELVHITHIENRDFTQALERYFGGPFISRLHDNFFSAIKLFFTITWGEDDAEIIDWWMWENNFGLGSLQMKDGSGKDIPMRTVDQLYNYLTKDL